MKGISLPINIVVIVAIVALVFAVIGYFFFSSTGTQLSRVELEKTFSEGCSSLCRDPCTSSYLISKYGETHGDRTAFHTKFAEACYSLGYVANVHMEREQANTCLTACGSCTVQCSPEAMNPES